MLLSASLCVVVVLLSVLAMAVILRRYSILTGGLDRWLAASTGFVVGMNLLFGILSLLPMPEPLKHLVLPIQMTLSVLLLAVAGPRDLLNEIRALLGSLRNVVTDLGSVGTAITLLFILLLGIYSWLGMTTTPLTQDEMSYHAPQAIGMVQEGRLRSFDALRPWVLAYPTGAPVLWAWTMIFTGGDILFRLVQVGFGLQLVLGAILLSRRSGADLRGAMLIGGAIIAMPIYYRLVTTVGADLGYNAGIVLALAFLGPVRNVFDHHPEHDLAAAVMALSQAVLIKIPVTAIIAFSIGITGFMLVRIGRGAVIGFLARLVRARLSWAIFVVPVLSGWTYWLNWVNHGNPLYPLTLRVAGIVIFSGPIPSVEDQVVVHSTFGQVLQMHAVQRWHAVFADWFQPINEDAFGGPGAIFLIIVLFAALLALVDGIRRRDIWLLAMGGFCIVTLAIPAAFLPRYSLAWLCVLAAMAGTTFTAMQQTLKSTYILVSILLMVFLYFPLRSLRDTYSWLAAQAAPVPLWQDRGRSVFEHSLGDRRLIPAPEMLRTLRRTVADGETLVYSVPMLPYMMWNNNYGNRILYVPQDHPDIWLSSIDKLNPEVVLVSAASKLSHALIDRYPEYHVVVADPETGDASVDALNMILLRR